VYIDPEECFVIINLTVIRGKAFYTKFGDDIFSNFSQFVAVIWWAEEFSCSYFPDCFIIVRSYSLIQFIFCTEATEGSPLDGGESDAQKFLSSTYCCILFQSACSKPCHVIVNVSFPLNRTAMQLEGNTVHSESCCALRLWYVDLDVSIEFAVEMCCCFTVFSC
jgi:hypothetical protein